MQRFQVIIITAYELKKCPRGYRDIFTVPAAQRRAFLAEVREEFRLFTLALARFDRTIIVSNWEAENDVPDARNWPLFVAYMQARIDGVMLGRSEARRERLPGKVFTAFEFIVIPGFSGKPSGLVEMGAKLKGVDYWSYSSWHSIGFDHDAATLGASIVWGIKLIRDFTHQRGLSQRIIIGEFGEYWNFHGDASRLKALVDSAIDSEVDYLINWTLYEQPGEKDDWGRDASHFGKFNLNRYLTPQGQAMRRWF